MIISLIRMRTMAARLPGFVRGFAVWMAFSLMLAFTPCCEIFAGAHTAPENVESRHAPDPDSGLHSHEPDGHRDICGKWLDNASSSAVISDGVLTSLWQGKVAVLSAPEHYLFVSHEPHVARWRPLHSLSPPHALYLLFTRLLL